MKAFFAAILFTISGLLGFNKQQELPLPTPTSIPAPTIEIIDEVISPTPTPVVMISTSKPTVIKPRTPINEEILKTFFGVSDRSHALKILNDKDQLQQYEQEFYRKFLSYPIPRIKIISNTQLIAMPSVSGIVFCTGEQLKKLYEEISNEEKLAEFEKMDYDCHHNSSKQETVECQEWRRVNDMNREEPKEGSLEEQIQRYTEKLEGYINKKNGYDNLLIKHCKN